MVSLVILLPNGYTQSTAKEPWISRKVPYDLLKRSNRKQVKSKQDPIWSSMDMHINTSLGRLV
jgi:hypothetical protein